MSDAPEETRLLTMPWGGSFEVQVVRARRPCGRPPLILVPGIGGPRGTFHHQVRAFAETRDVVATNLNPAQAPGVEPIDSSGRDVLGILDALAIERADLLGASFGSCVVAHTAASAPARVRRQVWVAPPVVHHGPWRAAFGPGWLLGGALMKFAPERARGEVARLLAERRVYSVEPDLSHEELLLLAGRVNDTELGPFFRRLAGLRDWDWRRLAAPASRPALVVQGERERAVTPPDVATAWARLSGRPVAIVPGTHMPYLSFPHEFNAAIEAFLSAPEGTAQFSERMQ